MRPSVVDFLERVDHRQRGDRAAPARALASITRSIVASSTSGRAASCTSTIFASSGRSSSPFATRLAALAPADARRADDRRRTGRARAADRRRTRCGSTHDDHRDVGARHERLHAVQQHRLAGDPAELLQLARRRCACRCPPATMTTPTSRAQRRRVTRRSRSNEIGDRAHAASSSHVRASTRFGTRALREIRRVVIPILAASARRRSACDTGRISPPSPTSPRNTASRGQRAIVHARRERRGDGEIARRLLQPDAADDVEEDVELREREAGALVEHREQQREAPPVVIRWPRAAACRIPPSRRAPGPR